jgi:hypothetical protein
VSEPVTRIPNIDEMRRMLNPWRAELDPRMAIEELRVLAGHWPRRAEGWERYLGDLVGRGVMSLAEASALLVATPEETSAIVDPIVDRWQARLIALHHAGVLYPLV